MKAQFDVVLSPSAAISNRRASKSGWWKSAVMGLGMGLQIGAGVGLIIGLVLAPWLFASTRHWAIVGLCEILSVTTLLWSSALLIQGRLPRIPAMVLWPTVFLFCAGWMVVLSGPVLPLDPFTVEHLRNLSTICPGSLIEKTPVESMWLFSGLFGALFVTVDLAVDRPWWRAFYTVMALTAASIVLLGLAQVLSGAKAILWQPAVASTGYFFATFFHYTVAGAFINLGWPLAAGALLFRVVEFESKKVLSASAAIGWSVLFLLGWCGLAAQFSRFAQLNGLILLGAWVSWLVWRWKKPSRWKLVAALFLAGLLFGSALFAAAVRLGRMPEMSGRWQMFVAKKLPKPADQTVDFRMRPDSFIEGTETNGILGARESAAKTCLRMIPSAGFLGFGPGSWSGSYPHFTVDPILRTFFLHVQFAHSDWLQTVVEWGILGAVAWGLIVAGGFAAALRMLRFSKLRDTGVGRHEAMVASLAVALAGLLLHGLIDFPLQIPSIQLYFMVLVGLAWRSVPGFRAERPV